MPSCGTLNLQGWDSLPKMSRKRSGSRSRWSWSPGSWLPGVLKSEWRRFVKVFRRNSARPLPVRRWISGSSFPCPRSSTTCRNPRVPLFNRSILPQSIDPLLPAHSTPPLPSKRRKTAANNSSTSVPPDLMVPPALHARRPCQCPVRNCLPPPFHRFRPRWDHCRSLARLNCPLCALPFQPCRFRPRNPPPCPPCSRGLASSPGLQAVAPRLLRRALLPA